MEFSTCRGVFSVCVIVFLYTCLSAGAESIIEHSYASTRDRLVTSENYPNVYPSGETFIWNWTAAEGVWAVQFLDFKLSCPDILVIRADGIIPNSCEKDLVNHHYIRDTPTFSMELSARAPSDPDARGFKCRVFHGNSRNELQMKLDGTKGTKPREPEAPEDNASSNELVIILLIIIVLLIVCALVGGVVWLLFRRRRHQQTTNTSVHLNIGSIRRDSAVCYSRNGTGGPPGEGRSRMGSESSLPPEDTATSPKRPVKRSGSNASWAMRAEMSTSVRNGSCSSETCDHNSLRAVNVYTPMPGDKPTSADLDLEKGSKGLDDSVTSRLSTIQEEPRLSGGKLKSSLLVPAPKDTPSLSMDNAGYILMTSSCRADYMNFQ